MNRLPSDEIHVWHANIDDFGFEQLAATADVWLAAAERSRLQRYYFEDHKKQLLLGRVLMRKVFSHYEALTPEQWQFCYNDYGKPALNDLQQRQLSAPLYFNLSHSRGTLVLAVARLEELGVDIECNTRARRVEKIATRYFSHAEVSSLLTLDRLHWQARFYDLWSLKEAYIKACGMGLAIDLGHFSFAFPQDGQLSIVFDARCDDDPKQWQFWQINAVEGFNLALAAKSITGQQIQTIKHYCLKSDKAVESQPEVCRSN
ncbi:MAG: 4'-phosphopantetheinyl transferase [Pseudohongiellaceae bacterium]|jgi:4'-phosphopantetheinyl transferase